MAGATKRTNPASNKDGSETDLRALRIQYGALGHRELVKVKLRSCRHQSPHEALDHPERLAHQGNETVRFGRTGGIRGSGRSREVSRCPIGRYVNTKRLKAGSKTVPCELEVYALDVQKQEPSRPEAGQREIRWCQSSEAAVLVDEVQLAEITNFITRKIKMDAKKASKKPFAR